MFLDPLDFVGNIFLDPVDFVDIVFDFDIFGWTKLNNNTTKTSKRFEFVRNDEKKSKSSDHKTGATSTNSDCEYNYTDNDQYHRWYEKCQCDFLSVVDRLRVSLNIYIEEPSVLYDSIRNGNEWFSSTKIILICESETIEIDESSLRWNEKYTPYGNHQSFWIIFVSSSL